MKAVIPGDHILNYHEGDKTFVISDGGLSTATVVGSSQEGNTSFFRKAVVPKIGDVVLARVVRTKRKEAHLVILATENQPLRAPLLAELRSVDIQERDVDSVIASDFCQPGDIIKARVVALGRSGFYAQLTTAEEGLGVSELVHKLASTC